MSDEITSEFWNKLVDCQLSSIEFVQDYLQLKFDGPGKALTIRFIDNSQIAVSLLPEDYSSGEAIYAHGFRNDNWLTE